MSFTGGSALGRVLGAGPSHDGAHHWWVQRVTAIALLPLTVWFVASLLVLPDFQYATVASWIGSLWHSVFLSLLLICLCWHSMLGVQVVIEDYVHGPMKVVALLLANFAHAVLAVAGLIAVLRLAAGQHG
jgi:succinate dehydrogenase / fumarate reductase, membrane anchor subunit